MTDKQRIEELEAENTLLKHSLAATKEALVNSSAAHKELANEVGELRASSWKWVGYVNLLNRHLAECPIDAAVCTSCAFVRRMLAEAGVLY